MTNFNLNKEKLDLEKFKATDFGSSEIQVEE